MKNLYTRVCFKMVQKKYNGIRYLVDLSKLEDGCINQLIGVFPVSQGILYKVWRVTRYEDQW